MRKMGFQVLGFCLIESLMILSMLVLLALWAMPAISGYADNARMNSATTAFLSSMQLARHSAVSRSRRVVLCKSADGSSCTRMGGWEQGWIVFQDNNNNASREIDEMLLHVERSMAGKLKVRGNRPVDTYIAYTSLGQTVLTSGAFQAGTVSVCTEALAVRRIVLSSSGRARTEAGGAESCV